MKFGYKIRRTSDGRFAYHLQSKRRWFWKTIKFEYDDPNDFGRYWMNSGPSAPSHKMIYDNEEEVEEALELANSGKINEAIDEYIKGYLNDYFT